MKNLLLPPRHQLHPIIQNQASLYSGAKLTGDEYKETILHVLASESHNEIDHTLFAKLYHPPPDFDINFEIDEQGHTPLHWATAMANVPLIKLLIILNANALQCNSLGFNCVTKSVFYNNCYKAGNFSEIISILRICLITPDSNGRLPLHYLVELSVNKTKDPIVIHSYIDMILQSLMEHDFPALKMCLNYQDTMGNTVLHLAALNVNLELCNKLCYMGASMDLPNIDDETPSTILAKFNMVPPTTSNIHRIKEEDASNQQVLNEKIISTRYNPEIDNRTMLKSESSSNKESVNTNKTESHLVDSIDVTENDDTHSETQHPTTINTILDELSPMHSLVTSSVIKDTKRTSHMLLEKSPMLYKRRSTFNDNKDSSLPNGTIHIDNTKKSPIEAIKRRKESRLTKIATRITQISTKLMTNINVEDNQLSNEIDTRESELGKINRSLSSNREHECEIFETLNKEDQGINSLEELSEKKEEMQTAVNSAKQTFIQSMEKGQALSLATLAQDEESEANVDDESPRFESLTVDSDRLKFAIEMTLLQFKRRSRLKGITEARCKINTSSKINKYRQLIGMTIENIDSKLDDIEKDLRGTI